MKTVRKTPPRFAVRPLALALAGGSLLSLLPGMSPAQVPPVLPSGLTVVHGQVKAVTTGQQLTVTNSANSILNWQSFSIGAGHGVSFVQPGAQSQVLNRVVGNDPSSILGSLTSNGKVWLLNPNGVIFGQGARIDVAGLVTSTLNLNDIDWLGGRYLFSAAGMPAGIVNQGELRSSLGGHIALLGGSVRNEGLIEASGGQVLLAAGQSIELIDTGSPNLRLRVTAPAGEALNLGTLAAAGGRIDVHGAMVNQQGIVRADSLGTNAAGEIVLSASQALTLAAGSTTSASGGSGGQVSLDSGTAGTTLVSGGVLATGSAGIGGHLTLLGRNVGVIDAAKLDTSGTLGGGQIHVGGGERGQDPAFRNADGVYIGAGASLAADALVSGDGGKLVLWSNEATRAYGSFTARGGPNGGNGGFIETSGRSIDVSPVKVDASAPAGQAGTWLLDPYDVVISDTVSTNASAGTAPNFTAIGPGTAAIFTGDIAKALDANQNVVISTGTGGSEAGNITMSGGTISAAPGASVSLTLQAANDIIISDSTIRSSANRLGISLDAGRYVNLSSNSITTAGGNFTSTSRGLAQSGSPYSTLLSGTTLATGGGSISIDAAGTLALLNNTITTAGGAFGSTSRGGDFSYSTSFDSTTLDTSGGNVLISGQLDGSTDQNAFGPGVGFASNSSAYRIDAGSGNVSIVGSNTNGQRGGDAGQPTGVRFFGNGSLSGGTITVQGTAAANPTSDAQAIGVDGLSLTTFRAGNSLSIVGSGTDYGVRFGAFGPSNGLRINATGGAILVSGTNSATATPSVVLTGSLTGTSVTLQANHALALYAGVNATSLVTISANDLATIAASVVSTSSVVVQSGNVQLATGGSLSSTATQDAIIVRGASGNTQQFSNAAGESALSAINGRWLVYSTDPRSDAIGTLPYDFKQYNAQYGTSSGTPAGSGDGFLYALAPTLTVNGGTLNKVYDTNTQTALLASSGAIVVGGINGDSVRFSSTGRGSYADKNVGNGKGITIASSAFDATDSAGKPVYGYGFTGSLSGNITPASISAVTGITANSRVYDTTTTATLNTGSAGFTGRLGSDVLTVATASGAFADKNAGTGKTVNVTGLSLGGTDARNYTLASTTASATGNITRASVSAVTGITANSRVYDTTTSATLNTGGAGFTGRLGSDVLTVATATGAFADKNAGTGKIVNVTGLSLGGTDAGNYTLASTTATATGNITPASISAVTGITANSRVYDSTTTATLNTGSASFTGRLGSDALMVATASGAFADKNAGTGKTVTVTGLSLGGTDAGNYTLASTTARASGNITQASISAITGITAADKTYDATTAATLNTASAGFTGRLGNDLLTVASGTGSFSDANAGTGKAVGITALSLGGAEAGNYVLARTTAGTTANIAPAALTITANDASKIYGTTLVFSGTEFSASGLIGAETVGSVGLSSVGAPASASVAGGPYPIVARNAGGGSFSAANYTITYRDGSLTVIPAEVNAVLASIVGNPTKVYDGSTSATLAASNFSLSGFIGSDSATVSRNSGAYDTANAGNRTVSTTLATSDFTPVGSTDLRNYSLPTTASGSGTITPRTLTLTGLAANNKVYDGTLVATLGNAGTLNGLVAGQTLTVSNTGASFDTKDAGTGKTVTVAGITLANGAGGTGLASNYQVAASATTTADITPRTLTPASVTAANKVYDGNTAATVTLGALNGLVGSETLATTTRGSFDTKDAGTGKIVSVGTTLANGSNGDLASNYRIAPSTASADITPAPLTITANSTSKPFGSTLSFGGTEFSSAGLVNAESVGSVTLTSAGAAAPASVAGGPYAIVASNATGGSFSASNYTISYANGTLTVTPAAVNAVLASIVGNPTKAYDGNTTASLGSTHYSLSGFFGSDGAVVTRTTGSYDSANAGARTVTATLANADFAPTGSTDLRNYTLPTSASGSGTITPRTLTLTGLAANNKVYDGTLVATLGNAGTLNGLVAGQTLTVSNTGASFDTKDAGTGKTVTVAGIALANGAGGTGLASNYQVAASATTTADITPRTLTPASVTAANKVYDGNTAATVTLGALNGLVGSETLATTTRGSFDTKDAGTGKTVSVGTTLANGSNGGLASNYRIAPSTASADITPKTLTLASLTASNKAYDGNTVATITIGALNGLVGSETLATTASGSFDTKDAGTAKTVTVGTTLSNGSNGGLASNYRLGPSTTTTADITPKTLTLDGVTVANKVYDGTTQATVTLGGLAGLVGSETLGISSAAAQFDTKDVGTAKPVTIGGLALANGTGRASNYQISATTASTTGDITPAALAVTANNASKTFGDALSFTGAEFTSTALVGNETITRVTLDSPGASATASVAGGPYAITPSNASGSFDPRNYEIRYITGSLTVNPANLSAILVGVVGNPTKVYDGSTSATLGSANFSLSGFIGSDAATITQTSGRYDSANAGARSVTVNLARSDYAASGSTDLRNYALPVVASGNGSILPKALTVVGLTVANKPYDGNTTATITGGTLSGLVGGETLLFANTGARFDNKDAGNGKTVTVGGLSLANGSGLASNYSLGDNAGRTTANITPAALAITANDANKAYGTSLSFNGSEFGASGLMAGETVGSVSLSSVGSAALASVAGGPYAIVASNATGGSFSASNYTISYANGTLTVTPAAVNAVLASIVGNPTKAYDGNTTASLGSTHYSLSGFFGSDGAVVTRTTGSYDSANAGARTVTATLANADFAPTGSTDLRNYTLPTSASGSGTITPRTLTLTGLAANNKVYDGTLVATLGNAGTLNGLVAGQILTVSNTGASFDTKDAGTGKTVTVAGITLANGAGGTGLASNYQVAASATTTADITPRTLTPASITAANKVYDGNTAATVTLGALNGLVGSETLATTTRGSFDTKDAGTGKTVSVGTTLANGSNGGSASNYRIAPSTASADITPATLTYTADAASKLVGAALPALSGQVSGFVAGESVVSATSGSLGFVTPARADSPAGSYAIDGGGLAATNYRFVQAPSNAVALTVTGLPPQETDEGSKTALSQGLASVTLPRTMSSPTDGRVVDVIQALLDGLLGQALLFRTLPVANLSMDSLAGLLNARDRYKKALFAEAIHQLELNPNLSDAPECQTIAEAEAGTCLITEKLKNEARAQRGLQVIAAAPPPAATPAVATPAPAPTAAPPAPPPPGVTGPAPLAPVVAAAPPPSAGMLRRRVRTASLPQIERKFALVIGVDRYLDKGIPQLDNAVRDARSIAQLLEATLGYDVVVLPDAGKGAVIRALNNLAIEAGPKDSVVIYYAGHGELVPATGLGYWQLADSNAKRPDSWLSNADITRLIGQIGASQVALISDSCYSGSLVDERFRTTGGTVDPQQLLNRKTVVVMSSGGNEPVFDEGKQGHSPFAFSLMNNLRQVANWQVGGNVFERVRFAVARELPQRPRYGAASAAGHQAGGDYLFEQRQLDAGP